jgi:membrane protein DedA with SNARE-associated domain
MIPLVRAYIGFPAGAARMPYARFAALSIAGSIPWIAAWAVAGRLLGPSYHSVQDKLHYVDILVAVLIVAGAGWLLLRRRQRRVAARAAAIDEPR